MAYRSSRSDFSERGDYPPGPPRRPPPREFDDVEFYERRERRGPPPPREPPREYDEIEIHERERRVSSPPPRRAPVREYDDVDIDVRVREREREDRTPAFLREDNRRAEAGPLVLRSREIETVDRRRPRSPSPQPQIRYRERLVERERERSPSPPPMPMPMRPRYVERSPSPPPNVRVDTRIIERRRERSPTPERERDHIRLRIEREREIERAPSPSPSPPPPPSPPPVIRGPTIEREVITHYRDIDHGIERIKPPSPPPAPKPAPPRVKQRETDIDIYTSRKETDIDIRSRSRSRPRERPRARQQPSYYDDDDIVIHKDREGVRISETQTRRRAQSAAPKADWDDEGEYITGKINSRGRMGEAYNGATNDWTIVDVPPGTERVKMDGVGGGGAEVTWQRYNGVRRGKFISEREREGTVVSASTTAVSEAPAREKEPSRERERLSVQIYNGGREKSRDRDVEVEEVRDRRISIRDGGKAPTRKRNDMWTEITKDLVVREAVERLGYEYEETDFFFYVMQYLRYEDVLELVNVSDDIRRERKRRAREIEWEREYRDSWERRSHAKKERKSLPWDKVDDERIVEREIIYDRSPRYMR
ncbi:Uu.00g118820.m01.CDS01 [Anthostomella pinea]|uniref:Uu.00g118820.m01.CDS01 n=1 Tax=Anthostomella pinea TaxID=933095 RepID=A0AAI8VGI6_9PEZI|nr:Uu.00g118820.m01.CDS01 [Anthostomella pinea]